ncbi:MAG: extracellular solute-binding protein [Moraxella sp.]|nr:extracellular solute-binding protein [Moraxella sp.]
MNAPRLAKTSRWQVVGLFVLAVLVGCGQSDDGAVIATDDGQRVVSDTPRALPDLTKQSVITTSVIAVKDTALHANATHLPYADPNAPKGGVLAMSKIGTFNSLNAFINKGTPATGTFYLYDTLMTGSLNDSHVLYPQLAHAVSYDKHDKSWVIYHINPKARFWDGTPVTAHDVKATFDAILTKGLMSWRGFLAGIDQIQALDDERVIFYFAKHANPDLYLSVGLMPVFAKADIDTRFDEMSQTPLMGSGAYRLGKVDMGRSVSYVKDPNYWGADVMANRGRFNFDEIRFVYYQDELIAKEAFLAGQFNFRFENDIKSWANFDDKAFKHIKKHAIAHKNPVTMQGLIMNLRRPLFADKRVRQALLLAFDWQWANDKLYYGQYERLTSFFYGSSLMAVGKPAFDEWEILATLPLHDDEKSALDGILPLPVSDGAGHNRPNLIKARELLLSAGFVYHDGKLTKDGQLVSFEILLGDDKHDALLTMYVQNLQKLGMTVKFRRLDNAGFLTKKRAFDYDMMIDSFMQANSVGAEQVYLWGSKSATEQGNANTIGIQSQAVDEVIERLIHAKSRDEMVRYARVLDRLLLAGVYIIPFGGQRTTNVMYQHDVITPPSRLPTSAIGLDYWYAYQ